MPQTGAPYCGPSCKLGTFMWNERFINHPSPTALDCMVPVVPCSKQSKAISSSSKRSSVKSKWSWIQQSVHLIPTWVGGGGSCSVTVQMKRGARECHALTVLLSSEMDFGASRWVCAFLAIHSEKNVWYTDSVNLGIKWKLKKKKNEKKGRKYCQKLRPQILPIRATSALQSAWSPHFSLLMVVWRKEHHQVTISWEEQNSGNSSISEQQWLSIHQLCLHLCKGALCCWCMREERSWKGAVGVGKGEWEALFLYEWLLK